jgi:prolyl-tRNA synthetase
MLGLSNPPLMLNDEEVRQVTGGASPGSCGPVGLKIPIYMDKPVEGLRNFIVGANKDDFHLKNVNHGRDFKVAGVADLRMAREGDMSPDGKGKLKAFRGIEVGHIFYLGTKYSKKMEANYLAQDSVLKPIEMGCYGIGISRTVQAVIEQNHDKDGIIWPASVAPYAVHIALLDPDNADAKKVADKLYADLYANGIDCLLDDRNERPGVKFKDADLLGMPLRVNIGARGLAAGELEVVERKSKKIEKIAPAAVFEKIQTWMKEQSS